MNYMNLLGMFVFEMLFFVVTVNVVYLFLFSVAGLFSVVSKKSNRVSTQSKKILVVFPAYREDVVIVDAVKSMLQQTYPHSQFTVAVVADTFLSSTIETLKAIGAMVLEIPHNSNRNKARAINYLFSQLSCSYDICIIMDADNVVGNTFLAQVETYFENGVRALQTKRVAKNTDGNLALLDAYSEIINNHIFRAGQEVLGFSSSLIGSGMAFEFKLLRALLKDMEVFSGFDKALELRLLEQQIRIYYAPEIEVLDEKVSSHSIFVNQRRRWIYAQFYFLYKNVLNAFLALTNGNFDYVNKVFQFALLPRIISIGLSVILFLFTIFFIPQWVTPTFSMLILLAIALFIPLKNMKSVVRSPWIVFTLFSTFYHMLFAILTSNKAAGKFLHTPHKSS